MIWQRVLDFGWLLFLLLVLRYFWRARQRMLQTTCWVKTRGRITRCEWSVSGHSVWPKIEYIYQVAERDYTGEYWFLDAVHNDTHSKYARLLAYKVVNAYKNNEDIDVYYNPDQPEQAVLDTIVPRKIKWVLWLVTVLIVAHILTMVSPVYFFRNGH